MPIVITGQKEEYIKKRNTLRDEKLYTKEEFLSNLYGYYKKDAVYYLFSKGYNLSLAEEIVKFLPFINEGIDDKTKKMLKLKEELAPYFVFNKLFKCFIKDKKILVRGLTPSFKKHLAGLDYEEIKEDAPTIKNTIKVYNTFEEEIISVINDIIKSGENLNNIGLIYPNEYQDKVERYLNLYNLKLNTSLSIRSSNVINHFTCLLETKDIIEAYEMTEKRFPSSKFLGIIKKLINEVKKCEEAYQKKLLIKLLNKQTYPYIYNEALDTHDLDSKRYIYLLGFNSKYPKTYKDEDYLFDKEKRYFNIETSIEKNNLLKEELKTFLKSREVFISFAKTVDGSEMTISSLYNEEDFTLENAKATYDVINSHKHAYLLYASSLDKYRKYQEVDELLPRFKKTLDIDYNNYDNSFKGRVPKEKVSLSYTALESFYECRFKYYLNKTLELNKFEYNMGAVIGSYMHAALEKAFDEGFDFNTFKENYIQEKNLNSKEHFFIDLLDEELLYNIDFIKEFHKNSSLKNILKEKELSYQINDKMSLYGIIDKIMYNDDNKGILIDYKSGKALLDLNRLKEGLNMQLFIYYLLFVNNFKGAEVLGIYLQQIINKEMKEDSSDKNKTLKLQGYTTSDIEKINLIDNDALSNRFIYGLKFKKDGDFYNSAKVLSTEEFETYKQLCLDKVVEAAQNIIEGKYLINPLKTDKGIDLSCMYCPYKDICFKTAKDYRVLRKEEV